MSNYAHNLWRFASPRKICMTLVIYRRRIVVLVGGAKVVRVLDLLSRLLSLHPPGLTVDRQGRASAHVSPRGALTSAALPAPPALRTDQPRIHRLHYMCTQLHYLTYSLFNVTTIQHPRREKRCGYLQFPRDYGISRPESEIKLRNAQQSYVRPGDRRGSCPKPPIRSFQ